ncbi:MAG: IS1595 family transposase [Planctomycetota bacterium]|nr:MAG: IS1595 family transposase [Planctomycetota bacterium]
MKPKNFMALTEDEARAYLESIRWPDGPVCPHCDSREVTRLQGKATRPGVIKCKSCRKQFTVTVGSIFERSHISCSNWVRAFYMVCCSKKGVSALQLQRMLGLGSYKTAWFMVHRIRWAMRQEPLKAILKGVVEADETWVGPRKRRPDGHNNWQENKTPVVALIQRDGPMRVRVLNRVTKENLKMALDEAVHDDATLMTDQLQAYRKITKRFKAHKTVDHSRGEYARGDVHCNTAESFFSLLKRGIHGTFHHVGRQHLHRYADEFAFRWNHRKTTDAERTEAALRTAPGKRLKYKPV